MLLFFVNNKEKFTVILLLEAMFSNDTHNVLVGKTSREERRDKTTLHTAKVMATLSAPLRKDLPSFLQELIPITRVYLQLTLWKPSGTTEQCSATQDLHKRRQRSEKGATWQQTYNQPIFKMCSVAINLTDSSFSSKPGKPQPLLLWCVLGCLTVGNKGRAFCSRPQEAKCYCAKLLCNARVLLKADSASCTLSIRRDLISLQGPTRNEQYNVHSGHNPWLLLTPHRNPFCLLLILVHSRSLHDEAEGTGAIYSL